MNRCLKKQFTRKVCALALLACGLSLSNVRAVDENGGRPSLNVCDAKAIDNGGGTSSGQVSPFQSGDRWCAIGDSITHSGRYHDYIYLFYATRFPDREVEFFNAGIAGDTAAGTLQRIEGDILCQHPTVATIMLGMNDVGRDLYSDGASAADLKQRREAQIAGYAFSLQRLAGKLQASGVRLIFITPSIFDQTVAPARTSSPGVNDALARCAEEVARLSREFKGELVDFYWPMLAINAAGQKRDPHFTLVGPDRIHPGEPGHFVMAYLFLKAQGISPLVADIAVDAAGRSEVSFIRRENALPFPVPTNCLPALKWVPFMEDLNQERLSVTNLPSGKYRLEIDGELVASFSAVEFAQGVNLALLESTPQYRQALTVAKLDEKRFELVRQLRTVAYIEGMMGNKIGDSSTFDYMAAAGKLKSSNTWVNKQVQDYLQFKPMEAEIQRQLKERASEIWKASRPRPHQFVIHRDKPQS